MNVESPTLTCSSASATSSRDCFFKASCHYLLKCPGSSIWYRTPSEAEAMARLRVGKWSMASSMYFLLHCFPGLFLAHTPPPPPHPPGPFRGTKTNPVTESPPPSAKSLFRGRGMLYRMQALQLKPQHQHPQTLDQQPKHQEVIKQISEKNSKSSLKCPSIRHAGNLGRGSVSGMVRLEAEVESFIWEFPEIRGL